MNITTRQQAIREGLAYYFTGKPCKHGHIDKRFTLGRGCLACNRQKASEHRAKNPDKVSATNREQYLKNRNARLVAQRGWNSANAEHAAAYAARYREANPEVAKEWRQRNLPRGVLATARRRAAKLQRTPSWSEREAIAAFYLACPAGHQVDHVLPLRGRRISGLHVLSNLQYLPDADNMAKGNRFTPYMVLHDR